MKIGGKSVIFFYKTYIYIYKYIYIYVYVYIYVYILVFIFIDMGPSIKYVTLFLANFDPPHPCHTLSHIPGPPRKYVTHLGTPPIFSRSSTKIPDKSPLYKFYLNCSRRFLSGGFVRVGFCPFPLLSQYICYNRKLNI